MKNKIKEMPEGMPPVLENQVYLGKSGEFKTEGYFNGRVCRFHPNQELEWVYNGQLNGASHRLHYTADRDSEIAKLNGLAPLPTIEEQIQIAKGLVGKRIKSISDDVNKGKTGIVERFEIITDMSGVINPLGTLKGTLKALFEKQGCAVVLRGKWTRLNPMCRAIGNGIPVEIAPEPEPWEAVKINGHPAERIPIGYKFGCAEVSTGLLRKAKELLEFSKRNSASNKKIVSIKIGDGEFSLDALNKLV